MNFIIAGGSIPSVELTQSPSGPDHQKLTEAAQQFEGMLLQEILKPMREQGLTQQSSEDSIGGNCDGEGDTLSSFGTETMATAIAKSGGLGIANRIVAQIEAQRDVRSRVADSPTSHEFPKETVTVLKSSQNTPMN